MMTDSPYSRQVWGLLYPQMQRSAIVWNLTEWTLTHSRGVSFRLNKPFFKGSVSIVDPMSEGIYTVFCTEDGSNPALPTPNITLNEDEMIEFVNLIGTIKHDWDAIMGSRRNRNIIAEIIGKDAIEYFGQRAPCESDCKAPSSPN